MLDTGEKLRRAGNKVAGLGVLFAVCNYGGVVGPEAFRGVLRKVGNEGLEIMPIDKRHKVQDLLCERVQ